MNQAVFLCLSDYISKWGNPEHWCDPRRNSSLDQKAVCPGLNKSTGVSSPSRCSSRGFPELELPTLTCSPGWCSRCSSSPAVSPGHWTGTAKQRMTVTDPAEDPGGTGLEDAWDFAGSWRWLKHFLLSVGSRTTSAQLMCGPLPTLAQGTRQNIPSLDLSTTSLSQGTGLSTHFPLCKHHLGP